MCFLMFFSFAAFWGALNGSNLFWATVTEVGTIAAQYVSPLRKRTHSALLDSLSWAPILAACCLLLLLPVCVI